MTARPHLVALLGPTASGKTAAAVAAARRLRVEVISADSRQVRRGMRIGTAAPSDAEVADVPHHLVGIVEPDDPFTVADWLERADAAIEETWSRGALPLLTGGTGQYVWALLEGWRVPAVPPDFERRNALEAMAGGDGGAQALHARLEARDPASAARIDPSNVRRVVRALEIVESTGAPIPPLNREPPRFTWNAVGLHWTRTALYERADARVDAMYAAGLVDETRALLERYGRDFAALRSMGYAEAVRVLDGVMTLEKAIERTKTQTHRLVRMQANWFRESDDRIRWVDAANLEAVLAAVEAAARPPVR